MIMLLFDLANKVGMDLEVTMQRFDEDEQALLNGLNEFCKDDTYDLVCLAWSECDEMGLEKCLQSIMGVVQPLGLRYLHAVCAELIAQVHSSGFHDSREVYGSFCDKYQDAINAIHECKAA